MSQQRSQSTDGTNLLALADAIEACLQINEMEDNPIPESNRDPNMVLLPSSVAEIAALQSMPGEKPAVVVKTTQPRQLMTQPLTVQRKPVEQNAVEQKPTAIFASRLPQPEGGPRPAHFVAAPGIELPQPQQIAAVKITTPAAAAAPARKQILFVQPQKKSRAPLFVMAAAVIAALGVGGYMERGKIAQYRASKSAPVQVAQVTQAPVAPVAAPVVADVAATPAVAQPVAVADTTPAPAAAPVVADATPAADTTEHSTARAKHRETHRQPKADTKPAADSTPAVATADAKPAPKAEAKADAPAPKSKNPTEDDMKKASDALLKAQLDSAI